MLKRGDESRKKVVLRRDTIRHLSSGQLKVVAAGCDTTSYTTDPATKKTVAPGA
jgi:hypothetical protein